MARRPKPPTTSYTDPEGDVLVLRDVLSPGTAGAIRRATGRPSATPDDAWQRRREQLFERLAVSWAIAGLEPITRQAELLGRFRMASQDQRAWVHTTIEQHIRAVAPELEDLL